MIICPHNGQLITNEGGLGVDYHHHPGWIKQSELLETQFNNILILFPLVNVVSQPTFQAMVEPKATDTWLTCLASWAYNSATINRTFINLLAATFTQATPICAKKQVRLALKLDVSLEVTLAGVTVLFTEGGLIQIGPVWSGMKLLKLNSIYKVLYININGKPIWQKKV